MKIQSPIRHIPYVTCGDRRVAVDWNTVGNVKVTVDMRNNTNVLTVFIYHVCSADPVMYTLWKEDIAGNNKVLYDLLNDADSGVCQKVWNKQAKKVHKAICKVWTECKYGLAEWDELVEEKV